MKKAITILFLVCFASCKSTPPILNTVATVAIDCTKPAISRVAIDTLTDGEISLLRDNWQSSLSSLVTKYGIEVVACVVGHIFGQSSQDYIRASTDINAKTKSTRAKIWLEENKIVFTTPTPVLQ